MSLGTVILTLDYLPIFRINWNDFLISSCHIFIICKIKTMLPQWENAKGLTHNSWSVMSAVNIIIATIIITIIIFIIIIPIFIQGLADSSQVWPSACFCEYNFIGLKPCPFISFYHLRLFVITIGELNSYERPYGLQSLTYLFSGSLKKKVCEPWSRIWSVRQYN